MSLEVASKEESLNLAPIQTPESGWTVISSSETKILNERNSDIFTCRAQLPDGTILQSNIPPCFNPIANDYGFKYFLIDQADINFMDVVYSIAKTEENKIMTTKRILNSTHFPSKRIYIRTIPYPGTEKLPNNVQRPADRVFAEEVGEMIPALLMKQGKSINDDLYKTYRKIFRGNYDHVYRTIPLYSLESILNEFGIDKKLVTLVRDPLYQLTSTIYYNSGGHIFTLAPDFHIASDVVQSMNLVLSKTVIGVNWKIETCSLHRSCMSSLRAKIKKLMSLLLEIPKPRFINHIFTDNLIGWIKASCTFKYPLVSIDRNYHFRNFLPESNINLNAYIEIAKEFKIPRYINFLSNANKKSMPVWMVRVFYKLGVIEQFFEGNIRFENENVLMKSLLNSVPVEHVDKTFKMLVYFMDGNDAQTEAYRDPAGGKVASRSHYLQALKEKKAAIKQRTQERLLKKMDTQDNLPISNFDCLSF